ncbi:MAG: DUF2235 domain-containing protein [Hydrogenophaga sp.]|uniref:RHS repeat-associated core domain-containing protein n=1 Tax=Hydrogenophaga sp. TaxID=1904254 RepID=UPI00257D28F7|nr:RHS repeat-associated core domain-containing protein [Hydrogenophaga sp.]MBL0942775.1 DUF2235 domain-containing protein [Hydrogenophaga sp.]
MDQRLRRAGLRSRCGGFLLALAVAWAVAAPAGAAAIACDPTQMCCAGGDGAGLGSPCGGAGVATLGNASGTDQGVGNPIHVIGGNKHQREVDMAALPGVLGLELVRHYNSAEHGKGVLGRGWRLSYESELSVRGDGLQIVQGDGTRLRFERVPQRPGTYRTREPLQGRVRAQAVAGGTEHVWTWADGRELRFNPQGRLEQIRVPSGEFLSLRHDERGWLREVIDPAGRRLVLHYPGRRGEHSEDGFRGVYAIDTPVGRFGYAHGAALPAGSRADPRESIASLVRVTAPAAAGQPARVRHYHHEDPRWPVLLTGISEQQGEPPPQRLSTWAYDAQGRAVLSFKGERRAGAPGLEQVRLQWLPTHGGRAGQGHTRLTNSLGQTTDYTTALVAGQPRILQVRGAGCAACGPANVRYAYDRLGRLVEETRLDARGRPVLTQRSERDAQGRVTQRSLVRYRRGQPLPAQWRVRYAYAPLDTTDPDALPEPQPLRIERPSVVAGRVHTLRLAYNAARQLLRVDESGYSPVDGQGRVVPNGVAIERSTGYGYATINGRSVRVLQDGPLPNGPLNSPADSDITRYGWDARGDRVVQITRPGGEGVRVAREPDTGRVQQAPETAGHGAPAIRETFDAAGRLLWQADARGILRQASYDSEGHLLATRVVGAGIDQQERYERDARGRLRRVSDDSGAHTDLVRDEDGRIVASIDPLGRWTRYEREAAALRVVQAANTHQPLTLHHAIAAQGRWHTLGAEAHDGRRVLRRVTHRRWWDDFGREVAVEHPDSGRELRRFDAMDRLVGVLPADGSRITLERDTAGRLVQRRVTPPAGSANTPAQTVHYRYQGGALAAVEGPEQTERYARDEQGRVVEKAVSLRLNDGRWVRSTTRYRRDDQGLLAAQSLPDGSELQFERNGQGQVVALHWQPGPWAPFGAGRVTLARDLRRDLIGLTHIGYGNGIEGDWQRSRQGVLAHVAYTAAPPATAGPRERRGLWDSRLRFDAAGNVLLSRDDASGLGAGVAQLALAYGPQDQLLQAVRNAGPGAPATTWRYHHDSLGDRLLAQQPGPGGGAAPTERDPGRDLPRDGAGRVLRDGTRQYAWDGLGRLTGVTQAGETTRYRHDHRGLRVAEQGRRSQHHLHDDARHRIADLDAQGRITRQYVWLGKQLLAVIDPPRPVPLRAPAEGLWQALGRAAALAWQGVSGARPAIRYVHANHLGAPVAATDERGATLWTAVYTPFGQRLPAPWSLSRGGFRLDLRLPGQWEDEATGLHANDQRVYDPQAGRYLSPDPLGLAGGLNAYAYVGNNPLGHVDPLGLVLFAFDGTDNTNDEEWLRARGGSVSNVWRFRQLYGDGDRRYVSGVGTLHRDPYYGDIVPPWLDNALNHSGVARIDRMLRYFNDEADLALDDDAAMAVDIVGFSRGASEARDFANQVVAATRDGFYHYTEIGSDGAPQARCQRVDLRFMGLFDTVLSTNAGRDYQLAIPDAFTHVAQAVALNEYRGNTLHPYGSVGAFPLESIAQAANGPEAGAGHTRIERGFVGAHADIGGGFAENENQLSQVALVWMVEQAKAAGVHMNEPESLHRIVANPVVHDRSNSILTGAPDPGAEDRPVRYGGGDRATQRQMPFLSGMSWADTAAFVDYLPPDDPQRQRFVTGTVDMQRYLDWLNRNGYGLNLKVE